MFRHLKTLMNVSIYDKVKNRTDDTYCKRQLISEALLSLAKKLNEYYKSIGNTHKEEMLIENAALFSKQIKLSKPCFEELKKIFEEKGSNYDLLLYDDGFDRYKASNKRIGVLALYSLSFNNKINYDKPFNIEFVDKKKRCTHLAFIAGDFIIDPILDVNGEPIMTYLYNLYITNPDMRIAVWSSVKTPLTKSLMAFSEKKIGINKRTFAEYCENFSTKVKETIHEDLYLMNTEVLPKAVGTQPIVEHSELSVKPKRKRQRKTKVNVDTEESTTAAPKKRRRKPKPVLEEAKKEPASKEKLEDKEPVKPQIKHIPGDGDAINDVRRRLMQAIADVEGN